MISDNLEKIKELRNQGLTLERIGYKFGTSRQRISQILNYILKKYYCFVCKTELIRSGFLYKKYCEQHKIKLEGRDRLRELVRIRDNHTCQNCKKVWKIGERRFDIHHLDEELEGWDNPNKNPNGNKTGIYQNDKNNMDRMITYCHKCHLNLDSVRYKMTLEGRNKLLTPALDTN